MMVKYLLFKKAKSLEGIFSEIYDVIGKKKESKFIEFRLMTQNELWSLFENVDFPYVPLYKLCKDFLTGSVSGCDSCFRITEDLYDQLNQEERRYIKFFVTSKDCDKYWLKTITPFIFIEGNNEDIINKLPTVSSILREKEDLLKERYLPKGRQWFQWQSPRNVIKIDNQYSNYPKIYVPIRTSKPVFSLSYEDYYPLNDVITIVPKDEYTFFLIAYLNTNHFLQVYEKSKGFERGRYLFYKKLISKTPIPLFTDEIHKQITDLGKQLFETKNLELAEEIENLVNEATEKGYFKKTDKKSTKH